MPIVSGPPQITPLHESTHAELKHRQSMAQGAMLKVFVRFLVSGTTEDSMSSTTPGKGVPEVIDKSETRKYADVGSG
jgi:uncharacterized circularly permuted ATP-grasp superfamily protein